MEECKQMEQRDILQFQRFPIDDGQKDELYEITLHNVTGHEIRFEIFEGYVSYVFLHIFKYVCEMQYFNVCFHTP